jgi:hypothetical protein
MAETAKKFGPTIKGNYPAEMRRQLWPLCCGASILSGFKDVGTIPEDKLVEQIKHTIDGMVPDLQVYGHESMMPKLTFLTLNSTQMGSDKIMSAVTKAGFVKFAEATPRGHAQGFFVRDVSNSFKQC